MPPKQVYCEIGHDGRAIRIFRNKKMAVLCAVNPNRGLGPEPNIKLRFKAEAVEQIRRQVFKRDEYACVHCGREVVWEHGLPNSGEMDERQARGSCVKNEEGLYSSGEVSVANCQTLCRQCHTGDGGKHDRSPSFTRSADVL